jgi:apolipoprotein N-acyltransferase
MKGARLIVSPETGFVVKADTRAPFMQSFRELAAELHVVLVVGIWDDVDHQNLAVWFEPNGTVQAPDYVKTHLVPFMETYRPGDGRTVVHALDGLGVGEMICQDDNFTDLARGYGRAGVALVAVPTNDWREVAEYHVENSAMRALENGYGIVRAASGGVSEIVSPTGEVLARRNHLVEGMGAVVADLPVARAGTPYSAAGDWFVLACLALCALPLLTRVTKRFKARSM